MRKETICNRIVLRADEGMVLMRGKERVETALPADGVDESVWYEIPEEEYEKQLVNDESINN